MPADGLLQVKAAKLLFLMRVLMLIFILACGLVFIAGVLLYPAYSAAFPESFSAFGWTPIELDQILSRVGLSFDWWLQYNLVMGVLFTVIQYSVGLFIFYRKREDWFGIYVAAAFVLFGTQTGNLGSVVEGMYPALKPVLGPLEPLAWLALFLIFYAFPDGRFRPSWTIWGAAAWVISFFIGMIYWGSPPPVPLQLLTVLFIGVGVGSQVYRYRSLSTPLQRQQTKWVMLALVVVFVALLIIIIPFLTLDAIDPASSMALAMVLMIGISYYIIGLIPLSIALAILRYRLWDLDVIIRRTLVYGALSASLGLVYLGMVVVLQWLLVALTGESRSEIVTVTTTLAIAALFTPLRKRIQHDIDRRFYRKKYSAEQTLSSFAVMARQETDLDALSGSLMRMVEETIHPESLSLWLIKEEAMGMKYI